MQYLQLPCEMLIGSLSSGKPAPAMCSSVKYSNKASDLMVAPTLLLLVLCYRFLSAWGGQKEEKDKRMKLSWSR